MELKGIGLGLAALGRPGYINLGHREDLGGDHTVDAMRGRAHAVLGAAYDRGVRYFDAARSYGRAESFLASWIASRNLQTHELTVGSKWGYRYTADWRVEADEHEVKDHSLSHLTRQWTETKHHLGAHLSLYQIHSATLETGVLDDARVLEKLVELKRDGIAIGFSTSGTKQPETIERGIDATVDGVRVFDTVQATFNLLERSAGPALARAKDAGLSVIVKEAVANGRLTPRGNVPALLDAAQERGATPDQLAIAFVLSQPFVDVVLSGAATVEHLGSNLGALEISTPPTFDDVVEDPENYWVNRSRLDWN